jgi:hypothetical protein
MVVLTPDDLARKTHRAIMVDAGIKDPDDHIKIGAHDYTHEVMETDYEDEVQISAPEGSIVFLDYVTYGYGETVEWDALQAQKDELEAWATGICERHKCSYKIYVTANYW